MGFRKVLAVGFIVGAGVGLACASGGLAPLLAIVGFKSGGVAAGSLAAGAQSAIGPSVASAESGGLFAAAQSIGATGSAASAPAASAGVLSGMAGAVGGAVVAVVAGAAAFAAKLASKAKGRGDDK